MWNNEQGENVPSILTAKEVAKILRLDVDTVYRAVRAGQLLAYRFGRQWRFRAVDFLAGGAASQLGK